MIPVTLVPFSLTDIEGTLSYTMLYDEDSERMDLRILEASTLLAGS